MNSSEKRYFKIFASRHSIGDKNKYLKIFDVYDKQKGYHEKNLQEELAKKNLSHNLKFNRHYLHKLILKSLQWYNSGQNTKSILAEQINCIEILYNKGLLDQASRLLKKTQTLAHKYEYNNELVQLAFLESKMMRTLSFVGVSQEDLHAFTAKSMSAVKNSYTEMEYELFLIRLFHTIKKQGRARSESDKSELLVLGNDKLLTQPGSNLPHRALWNYYFCKSAYHGLSKEYELAHSYGEKAIHLMEANPFQIKESPELYSLAISNNFEYMQMVGKTKRGLELLQKAQRLDIKAVIWKNRTNMWAGNLELSAYTDNGAFDKAVMLAGQLETKLINKELPGVQEESMIILYHHISIAHFGKGNYKEANKYLNKISNETPVKFRTDMHCFARLLSLIIYYETGKADLLDYASQSAQRFLKKNKRLFKLEQLFLAFMNKVNKDGGSAQKKDFIQLLSAVSPLTHDKLENTAFEYFDYVSWIESKIENKSFAEIIRRKRKIVL